MKLFSYKMTHDSGFAPNPFHKILTLATCKPGIREKRDEGDWIAGFTSRTLNGDKVGEERLVYLMKVTKKVSFYEYWNLTNYHIKKPNNLSIMNKAGDNIYKPVRKDPDLYDFEQKGSKFHLDEVSQKRDLSGKYVLVSNEFYYFGCNPLMIPKELRPDISISRARYGTLTKDIDIALRFIEYVLHVSPKLGLINNPHNWPKQDQDIKISKSCK